MHVILMLVLGYLAIIAGVVLIVLFFKFLASGPGVILLVALCLGGIVMRARRARRNPVRR